MKKIFLCYSIRDGIKAGELKRAFEEYDFLKCFVAHDDIEPGSEWEQEILMNLDNSDYFVPLQTKNLRASLWCQQEAGFARAKKDMRIISIILDDAPCGFYARFQGIKMSDAELKDVRSFSRRFLAEIGLLQETNREEVEKRILLFKSSNSYDEAARNSKLLLEIEDGLTKDDILRIMDITLENPQITSSFNAKPYLKAIFSKNIELIPIEQFRKYLEGPN
jgi:hypothetical protein